MSRIGTISRRAALVGAGAVAGGLVVGFYFSERFRVNARGKHGLKQGQHMLTPYVRIDQDGVTIITPRADLGQGAYSIQAALVAEELDIAWSDIKVDPGLPSSAYANARVAREGLPIAATEDGIRDTVAGLISAFGGKFLSLQMTGGSSTVADAYDRLRMAGATAREVLLRAAEKQTGVARDKLATRDGAVITPDGRALSYASLAETAAGIELPTDVKLRDPATWRYLGKPMPRIDMVAKCTGTATFGIDIRLPSMVYATVCTNPRLGGAIRSYDDSDAVKARGVLKIVPVKGGVGVIADNTWRAFKAAKLIKFEWGAARYPASTKEMFDAVKASFIAERRDSRGKNDGDVDAALTGAKAIEAEYRIPYLAHAPLEPMNAVVQLKDGRLDIWTGTQIPVFLVKTAREMTGLSADDIHVHAQLCGGSFGRRLEDDFVRQSIELAMAYQGRPIKMTWTREEDMTHDFPRPLAVARMRGAVKDGKVDAYDLAIASPSVTTSQFGRLNLALPGPDIAIVAGAWDQPFRIPNYRVTGYRVPELVPVSSWRSVGASGNAFMHECFLDELIHAAGADPLQERLRLCSHEPSRKVLEAVGRLSNWGSDPGPNRARGLAFTLSFGVPVAEVVEIEKVDGAINIKRVFVAAELGKVLDPGNLKNQVEGAVIWALGHAMNAELTYADGKAVQTNYHQYEGMRLHQAPEIEVMALETTGEKGIRGIGEPAVPPAAPALANAIFAATGIRAYELPLNKTKGIAFV